MNELLVNLAFRSYILEQFHVAALDSAFCSFPVHNES